MKTYKIDKDLREFLLEENMLNAFCRELDRQFERDPERFEGDKVIASISAPLVWADAANPLIWARLHDKYTKSAGYDARKLLNFGEVSRVLTGNRNAVTRTRLSGTHSAAVSDLKNHLAVWLQKWVR